MKRPRGAGRGIILIGAVPRLTGALAIVMLLWVLFFWATSTPGSL
ncbi:MAG: hypothetical protein OXE76_00250 [Alphaproteobacteria bacterium]|nr:hypothetical protein [Alphaproteobacteria bacterium]